ncbi:MAG: putative ATP-binding protein involved in virulence [Bacillales bacterium]|nr:putative ATP-binding protein involved in virulence [Bacillales bacterium]
MKINQLYIENYKNLRDFRLDLSNSINNKILLIGKNGSGKSNLIEAITEIFISFYSRKDTNFSYLLDSIYNGQLNHLSNKTREEVRVSHLGVGLSYSPNLVVLYSGTTKRLEKVIHEQENLFMEYMASLGKLNWLMPVYYVTPELFPFLFIYLLSFEKGSQLSEFIEKKIGINNFTRIELSIEKKSTLREPAKSLYQKLREHYKLSGNDDKIILATNEDLMNLKDLFGYEYDLYTALDWLYRAGCLKVNSIELLINHSSQLDFMDLSEGEKQLITIYAVSELFSNNQTLFLLDEPDSFLHPTWQIDLISEINLINSNQQFLITTHSPIMLPHVRKENVFIIDKGEIINSPYTYGRDFDSILNEAMGVNVYVDDIENDFDTIFNLIEEEKYNEAENILIKLSKLMGEDDKRITRANSIIEFERD